MMPYSNKKIILILMVIILSLAVVGCSSRGTKSKIYTKRQFEKIQTSMTYDEVTNLLGNDGNVVSRSSASLYNTAAYLWQNQDGSNMTITFQNGEVISKRQNGLR
ncbi:DUF3862 domain-containing protein [Selenihalanaerobacter shriftii]|uniref:SmpA / OmlA family protein n=1 Tax=Selenihalanaerobacter shriftii TaxID=142842 RepID=A0A1T4LDX3_9FIRM|nr:DUF3862 domain-containing protein [Selenihalanaerobacter shriftii]SJZ52992.1 protein of unknown function [Selenihalanaerobacter shriftii]